MNSSDDPDQSDVWSNEFPSNTSRRANNNYYPYTAFNDRTASSQTSSAFGGPSSHELSEMPGSESPLFSMEDYEIRFGTHSLDPPSPPPGRGSLEFEDIVNLLALDPTEPHLTPASVTPTPSQAVPSQPSGSVPLQIPTAPHFNHEPLGDHSMSGSLPYRMHSDPSFVYLDNHRARSGSYSGPSQGPYPPSVSSPGSRTTRDLGFGHPFHLEPQRVSHGRPGVTPASVAPTQHISHVDAENQPSIDTSIAQPSWGPFPMSPSDDSSSSTSRTASPAMSTSSLANLPSSSNTGGETHRWRLQLDTPGWTCDCGTNAKKRKRHLESCPRNPDRPTIQCPCCTTVFTGGSRNSALRRHMQTFHEDQMDLLKKRKD